MTPLPVQDGSVQPHTTVGEGGNPLSEREMEVAQLLVTGASNAEIARALVISPHTVKVHLRNVFDKLQVSSRTEASLLLIQRGWVIVPGVEVTAGGDVAGKAAPLRLPDPSPLADLPSAPQPWQLAGVGLALVVIVAAWLLPGWLMTARPAMTLLSDGGEPRLGQPVIEAMPRWTILSAMPVAASRMAAAKLAGDIYVVGGEGAEGKTLDVVAVYTPNAGQWRTAAPLPAPRANLGLSLVGEGLVVAGGNRLELSAPGGVLIYDDMVRYDRATDSWQAAGKLPLPLAGAALVTQGNALYLLGGWNGQSVDDRVWRLPLAQVDVATPGDWALITHLPRAAGWLGAVTVGQTIYVAGGYDGRTELADFQAWEVSRGAWQQLASLTAPRGGLGLVYDDLTVVAVGGGWTRAIQTHERYDALTNQWLTIPSPIQGEWRNLAAVADKGNIYLFGGWGGDYLDTQLQYQSTFRALLPAITTVREGD